MCGGSTSVSFPGPTAQEQELQQMQLDDLKSQKALIEGFEPFVLQQFGLQSKGITDNQGLNDAKAGVDYWKKIVDAGDKGTYSGGKVDPKTGLSQGGTYDYATAKDNLAAAKKNLSNFNNTFEYTPEEVARQAQLKVLQKQALDLATAQNQRSQDALAGKIGASAALTNQQARDFDVLKEDQGRLGNEIIGDSLDNATAKSTTGIQALEALRKTYGSLKSQELEQIIQGGPGLSAGYTSNYRSASPGQGVMAQGSMLAPLAGMTPQYGAAYQPYQFQRQGDFSAGATNAANNQSFYNTILTGLVSGGSMAGAAKIASSRTFKKDITRLTEEQEEQLFTQLTSTPTYRYRYTDEASDAPRHIGFVTEEAPPEVLSEDGKHISVVDYLGVMAIGMKVMSRKLDRLMAGS